MSVDTAPQAITWDQASAWIHDGSLQELGRLQRSAEQLAQYRAFRQQLLLEWASVLDYMKQKLFHCTISLAKDGRKCAEVSEHLMQQEQPVVCWRENDFPYYFEEGISHHVLWSTKPLGKEAIEAAIGENLPGAETLWWINPPELQSIRALWHCHVLSRAKGA